MKKVFNTILFLVIITALAQVAKAQINLEHTFVGKVDYAKDNAIYSNTNYYLSIGTDLIKLYNEDYSLYKSITIASPANYFIYNVNCTKNIVTTDGKIALLVTFYNGSAGAGLTYAMRMYDENGTILKDFGYMGYWWANIHITSNNKYRLTVIRNNSSNVYATEIYSLPGTVPIGVSSPQTTNYQPAYPNPANTIITLPYQLQQGEMSVMKIYNLNGQLVESKQIDYVFDKILLNVSGYAKGVYLYEVNGVSNRFIVE